MEWSLREATLDDLDRLAELEARVQTPGSAWTRAHFQEELDKPYSRTLVLTDDETDEVLIAFVVYWVMEGEAQVLNIAVDIPHRRIGLGRALLDRVVQDAIKGGIKRVILDVRKDNEAAVQLYHQAQFLITNVRKGYYSNGEDAYQMVLDLSEDAEVDPNRNRTKE